MAAARQPDHGDGEQPRSDTISAFDCIGLPSHDDICCRVSGATAGPGSDSEHFRFPQGPAWPFGGTLTKLPRATSRAGTHSLRAPSGHPTATLAASKGRRSVAQPSPGSALLGTARSWRGIVPFTHLAREGRMTVTIGRRELLAALGGAAAWPLAVLLIVAALVAAIPALAHSWYPLACCGKIDCFPVACDQLVETGSGWFYVPTGNLFNREQVQPSQDPHCHVC